MSSKEALEFSFTEWETDCNTDAIINNNYLKHMSFIIYSLVCDLCCQNLILIKLMIVSMWFSFEQSVHCEISDIKNWLMLIVEVKNYVAQITLITMFRKLKKRHAVVWDCFILRWWSDECPERDLRPSQILFRQHIFQSQLVTYWHLVRTHRYYFWCTTYDICTKDAQLSCQRAFLI